MRLAIDVAQTCAERAGCAWHAHNLAHELSQQVETQDLLLYHDFGRWINADKVHGTRIPNRAEPFFPISENESKTLWKAIENREKDLPGSPDIVISNSFMCPRLYNTKLIYTIYDLCFWTHSELTTHLNRNICQEQLLNSLARADAFVFISPQCQGDFERYFPRWLERNNKPSIQVPPIRARQSKPHRTPSDRFNDQQSCWLHIGSIEPRKGINELLDAYEAYFLKSKTGRPLRLIGGKGWMSERSHRRIKEMSDRLPVFYEGYLSDQEWQNQLDQAFALICSSKYEGYGLPVDEAADRALPIISTPVPSFRKFSVQLSDQLDLDFARAPEAMVALETNKERYEKISTSTQTTAQESAPEKCAAKLLNFYQSVLHFRP